VRFRPELPQRLEVRLKKTRPVGYLLPLPEIRVDVIRIRLGQRLKYLLVICGKVSAVRIRVTFWVSAWGTFWVTLGHNTNPCHNLGRFLRLGCLGKASLGLAMTFFRPQGIIGRGSNFRPFLRPALDDSEQVGLFMIR